MWGGQSKTIERRTEDLRADVTRRPATTSLGGDVCLVQTTTKDAYPTRAQAFYYCIVLNLSGEETEGGTGTITETDARRYVWNMGSQIPPPNSQHRADLVNGRWQMSYG